MSETRSDVAEKSPSDSELIANHLDAAMEKAWDDFDSEWIEAIVRSNATEGVGQ